MGYVTKLGFVCSPSVIVGEPVSSNLRIVSASARSRRASDSPWLIIPAAKSANASSRN
jgi:hypothetical protein